MTSNQAPRSNFGASITPYPPSALELKPARRDFAKSLFEEMPAHRLLGRRSIHASTIQGGKELSTYPDSCTAQFERRTLPGEDGGCVAVELERICARLAESDPGFRAEVTLGLTRAPYEVDTGHPVVLALAASIERVLSRKPVYAGTHGWCDAVLLGAAGIPTAIFGPGGSGAHAAEEYASFSSVLDGARILAETIRTLCG